MTSFIFENPPFLSCHGSTIVRDNDGSYIVAWFAGTREGFPDTSIWWCQSKDGHWTCPSVAAKVKSVAHWNPVLHLDQNGVRMFFKVGRWVDSWDTWECRLVDGSWTIPVKMESSVDFRGQVTQGPVRGKIVKTDSGTLLAPSSVERYASAIRSPLNVIWSSVVHRSVDGGNCWDTKPIPFPRRDGQRGGIIQPSLWNSAPGVTSALIRSTTGFLWRSETFDDGLSWIDAYETRIPNPNSAVDVAMIENKLMAMVFNPVSGNWIQRTPLTIAFSDSKGENFCCPINIEHDPDHSFSYPFMIEVPGGIAVTYTWRREKIAFVELKVKYSFSDDSVPLVNPEIVQSPTQYIFDVV